MATQVQSFAAPRSDDGFFQTTAVAMAAISVVGFSLDLILRRASFAVPLVLHVHALVFFGWVALYLAQTLLADRGSVALHRRLGWIALLWMPLMLVLGVVVTIRSVRNGAPWFFDEREFLFSNMLQLLLFLAVAGAALAMRRRPGWHRRLMYCGMANLTGPAFTRLLPMGLLMPYGWWAADGAVLLLMAFGPVADVRAGRRVHPAWLWGIATFVGMQLAADALAYSPAGLAMTHAVTQGSAGSGRPIEAYLPRSGGGTAGSPLIPRAGRAMWRPNHGELRQWTRATASAAA